MNKELYKIELGKEIKDLVINDQITDSEITLVTDSGDIRFGSNHDQDCCENVYADFSVLKYVKDIIVGKNITEIVVKAVDEMGFLLDFRYNYDSHEKVFIPCYNYQNGYYGSNLELLINNNGVETKIDISNLVEDHID